MKTGYHYYVSRSLQWLLGLSILLACAVMSGEARAQDWDGEFTISPVGAPNMNLEAVNSGSTDGTIVTIGASAGKANQIWRITPMGDGVYAVTPSYAPDMRLSIENGGTVNGTPLVLQADKGEPWQLWAIYRNGDGSFSLSPRHEPEKGIDDFGGDPNPGARIDLWDYNPDDKHLLWTIHPLHGAKTPPLPPILPGVIKQAPFDHSEIYPGTKRTVTVFIPAQYDGSKPACVLVQQDGYNPSEKGMLEALIADKEMPVTIGVFVTPGDTPATTPTSMVRRNRCFEYDDISPRYVTFITKEILPFVEKTFGVKLSESGNDRCIAGGSSGGISAFNAAFERPNEFTRVYSNSGSFADFRGGNQLPELVRKYEPEPIRAYLTTGTDDMENYAGNWNIYNREMNSSFKYSGYDYSFHILTGPHVAGWNGCFYDAMRYIWKGWPQPVRAGLGGGRMQAMLEPGQDWQTVAGDFQDAHGFACDSKGRVYFLDRNRIYRIGADGAPKVFVADAANADGLTVDSKDEVCTVSRATGKIMRYDASGKGETVVQGIHGENILAMPNGSFYVADVTDSATGAAKVWLVRDGRKTEVSSDVPWAAGMAYRPDQWLLSVPDLHSKWVYTFQINSDGTLANMERFYRLHEQDWDDDAGIEAVCYAKDGRMLAATRAGVQVCADDGPVQAIIPLPDRSPVTGLCFGGDGLNTLYATNGREIWRRTVKPQGIGAFTPWVRVNGSPL